MDSVARAIFRLPLFCIAVPPTSPSPATLPWMIAPGRYQVPETSDLVFKLKRKGFLIEVPSLP